MSGQIFRTKYTIRHQRNITASNERLNIDRYQDNVSVYPGAVPIFKNCVYHYTL